MWDLKCLASALCFLTSNVLFIVHGALLMKGSDSNTQKANANDGAINSNLYDSADPYDANKENSAVKPMSFNFEYWKDLNPEYIESRWIARDDQRAIVMSAALIGAVAWFWLCVPIVQSAWVLSRGGKRQVGVHMTLASLAVCGTIIELMARLMTVGMTNASQWLAKDFNLDDWDSQGDGTGWRVLEMIHIVTRGMLLWIDAFEALALFGIVVLLFYSVASEPKFRTKRSASPSVVVDADHDDGADAASGGVGGESSTSDSAPSAMPPQAAFAAVSTKVRVKPTFTKCFVWYGLFVGLLALLDFVADVLRFVNWGLFGRIAMATNILLGVIFLPIWLLCLARQLPLATERFEREGKRAAVLLNAEEDEVTSLKGTEREIS